MSIVRLLIRCGADVNEVAPSMKSTPLHLTARCNDVDNAKSVIRLLLDANAHIDCIDGSGQQPEDRAWSFEIQMLLHENRKLSLKCRCAQLINLKNMCYAKSLSSNLIGFVRMHSRNETGTNIQPVHVGMECYPFVRSRRLPEYRPIANEP